MEKEHEAECLRLYQDQQEIAQQQMTIEKYQNMITNVISLREEKDTRVREAKNVHRSTRVKLSDEKSKEKNLVHELEQLAALQAQFSQWQTELASNLAVSKRVSNKNKAVQRELIAQKQHKDCIIFKLMEEVWKLKTEIASLDVQLQLKNKEKIEINRMIADINADLEGLHRQHMSLCDAWNTVVSNIARRNKVYEQLNAEREYVTSACDVSLFLSFFPFPFLNSHSYLKRFRVDSISRLKSVATTERRCCNIEMQHPYDM